MIKSEELRNPSSCMNRAADDEMTFVLLGRDLAAPAAIRAWAMERIRLGKNEPMDGQILEAMACVALMEKARREKADEAASAKGSVLAVNLPEVCFAELRIGDDHGDNEATMHCRLEAGHKGPHRESYQASYGQEVTVTWLLDERL